MQGPAAAGKQGVLCHLYGARSIPIDHVKQLPQLFHVGRAMMEAREFFKRKLAVAVAVHRVERVHRLA